MNNIVEGFGVRVSFIGHDLHGIIRGPDGRLYFQSVTVATMWRPRTEKSMKHPAEGRCSAVIQMALILKCTPWV